MNNACRTDEERCSFRQCIADDCERFRCIGEKERQRRLRPDYEVDVLKPGDAGEVEIVGKNRCRILGAPFMGLVDIRLNDAHAHTGVAVRRPCKALAPPGGTKSEQHQHDPGERRRLSA